MYLDIGWETDWLLSFPELISGSLPRADIQITGLEYPVSIRIYQTNSQALSSFLTNI